MLKSLNDPNDKSRTLLVAVRVVRRDSTALRLIRSTNKLLNLALSACLDIIGTGGSSPPTSIAIVHQPTPVALDFLKRPNPFATRIARLHELGLIQPKVVRLLLTLGRHMLTRFVDIDGTRCGSTIPEMALYRYWKVGLPPECP